MASTERPPARSRAAKQREHGTRRKRQPLSPGFRFWRPGFSFRSRSFKGIGFGRGWRRRAVAFSTRAISSSAQQRDFAIQFGDFRATEIGRRTRAAVSSIQPGWLNAWASAVRIQRAP